MIYLCPSQIYDSRQRFKLMSFAVIMVQYNPFDKILFNIFEMVLLCARQTVVVGYDHTFLEWMCIMWNKQGALQIKRIAVFTLLDTVDTI